MGANKDASAAVGATVRLCVVGGVVWGRGSEGHGVVGTGSRGTKPGAGLEGGRCDGDDGRNGLHRVGRRANDGTKDEQAELSATCLGAGVNVERKGATYAERAMLQRRRCGRLAEEARKGERDGSKYRKKCGRRIRWAVNKGVAEWCCSWSSQELCRISLY